jgi:hypothetical protein
VKQASDYKKMTAFIINHFRKTFSDVEPIMELLENSELIDTEQWHPEQQFSMETDPTKQDQENELFRKDYQIDKTEYNKRVYNFKSNKLQAYGLLWE